MLLVLLLPAIPVSAQTLRLILPNHTDPNITQFNNAHTVCINTNVPLRQRLFLFLPGTGGVPAGYTDIVKTAANLGFYALGVMYDNPVTVNSLCDDASDPNCFADVRTEIITGQDTSPLVNISRTDSIENRLIKLLQYLTTNYPAENWGQYLTGTNINWSSIIVSGHSQGAGHAGLIAKLHPVARAVMFADTDWWFPGNEPAPWISASGATSDEGYFGFVHIQDPLVLYTWEVPTWQAYGLSQFGSPVLVESNTAPYLGTHMFTTDLAPQDGTNYHGATVTDAATPLEPGGTPVFQPVWQYLLIGPPVLPALQLTAQGTNHIQITFNTRPGYNYQPQECPALGAIWSNSVPAIAGTGSPTNVTLNYSPAGRYYRVAVQY